MLENILVQFGLSNTKQKFITDTDDDRADYRLYQDLEQLASLVVNIKDCKAFEENNTIINPNGYFKSREYYKIQKKFFILQLKRDKKPLEREF